VQGINKQMVCCSLILSGEFFTDGFGEKNGYSSKWRFSIENLLRKKYRKTIINHDYLQITIAYFQIENLRLYRSYTQYGLKFGENIEFYT
jgi:hypothetical protein